jgi:hypothetical protein
MAPQYVVAVRPIGRPDRPYKYVAGGELTFDLPSAAKYETLDRAMILAAQVRILAGPAYCVVVLPTE